MSADAIIKGLTQGNAAEMELVRKLKEGLDFIAEGMRNECFNRSDALSELKEKLHVEGRNADPAAAAERKKRLAIIIKNTIRDYEDAIESSHDRWIDQAQNVERIYEIEENSRLHCVNEERAREQGYDRTDLLLQALSQIPAAAEIYESLQTECDKERDLSLTSLARFRFERDNITTRRLFGRRTAKAMYVRERNALKQQIENLQQVAELASIEMEDTSMEEQVENPSAGRRHTASASAYVPRSRRSYQ